MFSLALGWGCDSPDATDGQDAPDDGADGTDIADAADGSDVPDSSDTSDATGGFACGAGGLVCDPGSVCVGTGQGACMGDAPGPDGHCRPNCEPYTCGGFDPVCLCSWFECEAPPSGCHSCACLEGLPGHASCLCEERDGNFHLDCPGA